VRGLFPTPRETEADVHRSIGPIPASQFSQWDGSSVVLYDLETGVERDLGEGSISAWPFSPDGTKLAWISGPLALRQGDAPAAANKVWVLDLTTMQRRSYGEGWQVTFHDDATLRITRDLGPLLSADFVDLFSGVPVSVDQSDLDVTRLITQYSHGYRVERLVRDGDFAHAR
jgi:hypothetical protein